MNMLWIVTTVCAIVFVYHHALYPLLLKFIAARATRAQEQSVDSQRKPRIGILMCAYNEQAHIRAKLDNLAMLDYPAGLFDIHVGLDGCTDNTENIVDAQFATMSQQRICCSKLLNEKNLGKIATLNRLIQTHKGDYDVLLFTDISALLSMDALNKVADAFNDPSVGVVSGNYQFLEPLLPEQQKYWNYQNSLKSAEGALGAVIGVPGAMFAMRSELVERVPSNTINDDFVLPMRALQKGFQAVVDPDLGIVELESDTESADRQRRVRIGAGNIQQLWVLRDMLNPNHGWAAFNFFSGKGLRALMPLVLLLGTVSIVSLSMLGDLLAQTLLALGATALSLPSLARVFAPHMRLPILPSLEYLVINYTYALCGVLKWFSGRYAQSWNNSSAASSEVIPASVKVSKRVMDLVLGSAALVVLSPVMLVTAFAIKLSSKGPVFYKQLRVGIATQACVSFFHVIKFRTMVEDAERFSGAVWASENDPRITPIGRFLRRTRIDELPQLWNVIVGEMSLVGPRPERPDFHHELEFKIPMFTERTYGVKPGITGLAQVKDGYPNDIPGMRQKLAWDMAYSLTLANPLLWLKTELAILLATVKVVVLAKGQ